MDKKLFAEKHYLCIIILHTSVMKKSLCLLLVLAIALDIAAYSKHYTASDGLPNNEVWQVVQLPNKQMLVETAGAISLFDGRKFCPLPIDYSKTFRLPFYADYGYRQEGDSLLWLGDFYNLYLLDTRCNSFLYDVARRLKGKDVKTFVNTMMLQRRQSALYKQWGDSLLGGRKQVTTAFRDHEGGLWLGTMDDGIYYFQTSAKGISTIAVPGVKTMATCGAMVVLGRNDDILLYDPQKKTVVRTLAAGTGLCHDESVDKSGAVWVSAQHGLYCYRDGHIVRYCTANCHGLLGDHVRFACPLDDHRLLVCNLLNGIGYFYPETRQFVLLNKKLPDLQRYRVIVGCTRLPTEDGCYVLYTQNGMFVLDTTHDRIVRTSSSTEKVNCMMTDSRGQLWAGTPNGLLMPRRLFTARDGLPNAYINNINEDGYGNLWLGTSVGIVRMKMAPADTSFTLLGERAGLPTAKMTERASTVLPDGHLLMAFADGMADIDTRALHQSAGGQTVTITRWSRYDHNRLSVSFSTLNYSLSEETRYRYRLQGLDDHWNHVGQEGMGTAVYSHLPAGHYVFEVEAAGGDGTWGTTTKRALTVEPPLWLSWWAKVIYALVFIFCLSAGLRLYLKRQEKRMAKDNDERVNRLFELREVARENFAHNVNVRPEKLAATEEEKDLLDRLLHAIENNMSNADYTVDQMAADVALSRSNLYRRMQAMLGITPNDFLRNVRLKRAATLLAGTNIPVSQVAVAVGFGSARYFSQYFKKMFGVTPSEYRKEGANR